MSRVFRELEAQRLAAVFEVEGGEIRQRQAAPGLGAASAALPAGAYTTLRTYRGNRIPRLDAHLHRLEETAALQGHSGSLDASEVRRAIAAALAATGHPESRLRLTFAPPRLFVAVEPFQPLPDALYRDGAWCVTVPVQRKNPRAKDTAFIAAAEEAYRTLPAGAHEGLLVAQDGSILEGLTSNFFAVREGILHTEEDQALSGVTRSLVLEAARPLLPRATRAVRMDQLGEVDECFLTSTSRGVMPVTRIDSLAIGRGRPGTLTRELARRFEALVEKESAPVNGAPTV